MASKKTKAATAAEESLDELFSGIGDASKAKAKAKMPTAAIPKPYKPSAAKVIARDDDILADLESQLASQQPSSRPETPRLKDGVAIKRAVATPPATADDKASFAGHKSTDNSMPSATSSEARESERNASDEQESLAQTRARNTASNGGGWWGGILSTASAAMKQAEAAYKEIQQNDEAKWAEQVKGLKGIDVGTLRSYGDELRSRALPTFANILHTLAPPPIGSHERLLIHITHDLVGYPSLDPLVHGVFTRVMSQVEGGDLLVVQRGHESSSRRLNDGSAGWRDRPWWRQADSPRELGVVAGLSEATKLCRAGAESYADEYYAANGGVEQARIRASEDVSESNPTRTSDLFLAVQVIIMDEDRTLFARTASAEKEKESSTVKKQVETDEVVCFAVFVLDPIHEIEFSTVSQSVPAKWVRWLDAPTPPMTPGSAEDSAAAFASGVPEDIRDILSEGSVDPRAWVAEWIEEALSLAVGVVAQRYVARRMGVGEGGLGRGKRRVDEALQADAGESARACII